MRSLFFSLILTSLLIGACKSKQGLSTSPVDASQSATTVAETNLHHENLNAVLWVQSSAEYAATTHQAFTTAQLALDEALDDPTWTASLEQERQGSFEELPAAVILDVDETVLDNSPYQAQLIKQGKSYTSESWKAWTSKASARAVPGALKYCQEAAARGVEVIYVTNRKAVEEADTRKNLLALGFPVSSDTDVVLTRKEREEWASSDKTPRRSYLAKSFRILQLIGDNLGDFTEVEGGAADRVSVVERYADYWGMRWIALPNPTYGSWNSALFHGASSNQTSQAKALQHKRARLRTN